MILNLRRRTADRRQSSSLDLRQPTMTLFDFRWVMRRHCWLQYGFNCFTFDDDLCFSFHSQDYFIIWDEVLLLQKKTWFAHDTWYLCTRLAQFIGLRDRRNSLRAWFHFITWLSLISERYLWLLLVMICHHYFWACTSRLCLITSAPRDW